MLKTGKHSTNLAKKILVMGLALALTMGMAAYVFAADSYPIKMCYNGPPDVNDNAVHLFASNFKKQVEKLTQGKVQVTLYPNSQLGNEEQRMEQVMTSPMINVASFAGVAPLFPEMFASAIPFMFDSYKAAHHFFDNSEFWKKAQAEFFERTTTNLVLAVEEGGFLAFTNSKRQIKSPADFKGLKFRAMDESQVALYKAFGASGTPIPWTEVYMALKTGVADGQMNPPMYIIMGSLFEVQKYMTMANIQYSDQFLVINAEWLESLPKDLKAKVLEAAQIANKENRKQVEAQVSDRVKLIASHKVEVYTPNKTEMDEFRKIGQPSFVKWLEEKMDKSWIELAQKCAEKANKTAGK